MAREPEPTNQKLTDLLDYLKRSRGFDFSGYKKTTLSRRIEKRMGAVGVSGYAEYQDYLEVNSDEFTELFNTILINVTSFFRDPAAWEFLASNVVPELMESHPDEVPIRVWSAGCASGEEAYTAAMVLAEAMGEDAFKSRVKLYATDLDDDALAEARHGVYSDDALKAIPPELVEKYFEPNSRGLSFRPDMRRSIIFGRNDLVADAPISRIDLLLCRNVLMYFTPEAQGRILERFNFALSSTGFLFLGRSEMLISHGELFAPDNLKWRIFRKVQRNNLRERLAFVVPEADAQRFEQGAGVRAAAAALAPVPQIVVDRRGFLVDANRRARSAFGMAASDIGRPFQDAPLSYRPADIRSAIDRAYEQRASIRLEHVRWSNTSGDDRVLDIEVQPVLASDGEPLGSSITFTDVTAHARLSEDYERSKREVQNAYEELQSTVEELETTNEELQSTNEELETTNEELQSTNEELETMNEELQSTNDELEVMNTEVNNHATAMDRLNLFFEGILGSLELSVIVIDRSHKIQAWNAMSSELWGLQAEEVKGQDFMALDIGLPVNELESVIALAFNGATGPMEENIAAMNRRGQRFECVVRLMPLKSQKGDVYAAMILAGPDRTG
ncbi:MAG TPA: CheR family methyltransferase [Thermoleophilaceae bacterium]|nr:CheR family methyltransferase [Thermoleophilaceae bacterium]